MTQLPQGSSFPEHQRLIENIDKSTKFALLRKSKAGLTPFEAANALEVVTKNLTTPQEMPSNEMLIGDEFDPNRDLRIPSAVKSSTGPCMFFEPKALSVKTSGQTITVKQQPIKRSLQGT